MKIENTPHITQTLVQAGAAGQQTKAPPPPERGTVKGKPHVKVPAPSAATLGAHATGVCVTLSPTARSMGVGRTGSDCDADKVRAVREAIKKGSFSVNAAVVADKLLTEGFNTLPAQRDEP